MAKLTELMDGCEYRSVKVVNHEKLIAPYLYINRNVVHYF